MLLCSIIFTRIKHKIDGSFFLESQNARSMLVSLTQHPWLSIGGVAVVGHSKASLECSGVGMLCYDPWSPGQAVEMI